MGRPSKHRPFVGLKPAINRTLDKKKKKPFVPTPIKQLARHQIGALQEGNLSTDDATANAKLLLPRLGFLAPSPTFLQDVGAELSFASHDSTLELVAPPSSPADSSDNEMELTQSEEFLGETNSDKPKIMRPRREPLPQNDWIGNRTVDVEMITQGLTHLLSSPDHLEQGFSADKLRRILRELPPDCIPTATDYSEVQDFQLPESTSLQTALEGTDALIAVQMPEFL